MTEKPFKKLRGYAVYLIAPPAPSDKIILTAEAKEEMMRERLKEFKRLKVYAVGAQVTDIEEGDEVYVHERAILNATLLELGENFNVIIINVNDIVMIW